jgi:hypothetical protein
MENSYVRFVASRRFCFFFESGRNELSTIIGFHGGQSLKTQIPDNRES